MAQVWVEVEENPNAPYLPLQVFEARGETRHAPALRVESVAGGEGPHEVVGWCSEAGGSPCEVTYTEVSDSGAAVSVLVMGGDYGIRMRPANDPAPWSLNDPAQRGEQYMLLPPDAGIDPIRGPCRNEGGAGGKDAGAHR